MDTAFGCRAAAEARIASALVRTIGFSGNSMTSHPWVALSILAITCVTLFWVALTDLVEFKIRNEFVIAVAGLYLAHAAVSGQWQSVPQNAAFATIMLACMLYAYGLEQIGGGDLKLLAAAFLWTGPWSAAPFALLLSTFCMAYYLAAKLGWATSRKTKTGLRIPLAPSIAGAMIGVFAFGFVSPAWAG
jgi:prepilin peptidase CpaA